MLAKGEREIERWGGGEGSERQRERGGERKTHMTTKWILDCNNFVDESLRGFSPSLKIKRTMAKKTREHAK